MRFSTNLSFLVLCHFLVGDALAYYAIKGVFTGINSATGERPARREINDLKKDVPAFSLYIQALAAMENTAETDQSSWFQVSGIHGRPYYAWDFVGNVKGAPAIGYCTHGDALFMAWHRPYLALYEQILAKHVQAIAKGYKSATYQTAADKFRIPYWDWAVPPYSMPDWFSTSTISITTATGVKSVTNPLAAYKFKRWPYISSTFPSSNALSKFPQTARSPNSGSLVSNPITVNNALRSQGPGIAQQLYTVFSRATSYNNMATQSSAGPSFEGPHGWLHVTVGGNGHMTDIGYSAFDPIFVLHHANVDRLGIMWQSIYPNSFMTSWREGGGTWTLVPGQTVNADTLLLPFHAADGKAAWTANSARYAKTFGYSYPDVKDWLYTGSSGAANLKAAVTARVNQLYNVNGRSSKRSVQARANPISKEWTVDISAPNNALNGSSYIVYVFLGAKPSDPKLWATDSVGAMYVLAQPVAPGAGAMTAHTQVIITDAMRPEVNVENINRSKDFLDKKLTWGVQKFDGSVIPNEDFNGLTILVEDDTVKLPTSDTQLPTYSNKTVHTDIDTETVV